MNRASVARALAALEVEGLDVVVHADLCGDGLDEAGAVASCEVLIEHVGPNGTIVMPAFTYEETLVGESAAPIPFHPDLPVSPGVGLIAETFRRLPGVLRSNHPSHSFTAYGRQARAVLSTQRDNNPLGPIKKLNVMRGHVLLLGTSLRSCTAIHLAEESSPLAYLGRSTAVRINAGGYEERVVLEHLPGCERAFDRLEARLDPEQVVTAPLGSELARKIPVRHLVRLAAAALAENPEIFMCEDPACRGCALKRAALPRSRTG
jgi:aminoglycoside 3-N-acetyltransferase